MTKHKLRILDPFYLISLLFIFSASTIILGQDLKNPKELQDVLQRKGPLNRQEEVMLASFLKKGTDMYVSGLTNNLGAGLQISPMIVGEANTVIESLSIISKALGSIIATNSNENATNWIKVISEISFSEPSMQDISNFKVFQSEWNVLLRAYVLTISYRIILPKVDLLIKRQK